MSLTPTALVLLHVQRWRLEGHPHGRELAREWSHAVDEARAAGQLIVLVQWNGEADTPGETFGKGWTLHPDFRVEAGDLPVRADLPDAFTHTDLSAELHAHAVRELMVLALPDAPELTATARSAEAAGFAVRVLDAPALA
ncbi:isochorismatase family protein [Deinococcus arenicola]|uniref:Isochorismatase family protein n=1 Tax=Deinococcus arenicola TaxID=2994950 RepID=A0ABU4DKV6_9DEIO|nr:isochorismatase family protein [Deinococcus sp. ZS9-10]MDV6373068.1 isochorismatase family protein [Deinococcus sp. ZS9-10]